MCRICVRNGESPQTQNIKFDPEQHEVRQAILTEEDYNLLTPLDFSAKTSVYHQGMYYI